MAYGNYAPFYRGGYFNPAQQPTVPQFQPMQDGGGNYQPQYQNGAQPNFQPSSDFIWVLNENEATAFQVMPNNTVVLWDKNAPTIYVKSVNAQGVPSMRILDFTERTQATQPANAPAVQFATLDAFNALRQEFEGVKRTLEQMQTKKPKKTEKTEVEDNE